MIRQKKICCDTHVADGLRNKFWQFGRVLVEKAGIVFFQGTSDFVKKICCDVRIIYGQNCCEK